MKNLALQVIAIRWEPYQASGVQTCSVSLRKRAATVSQKTCTLRHLCSPPFTPAHPANYFTANGDFAREDVNRVDAIQLKNLSSFPKNSAERTKIQATVETQYDILDEYSPGNKSQIIAICLHHSMCSGED